MFFLIFNSMNCGKNEMRKRITVRKYEDIHGAKLILFYFINNLCALAILSWMYFDPPIVGSFAANNFSYLSIINSFGASFGTPRISRASSSLKSFGPAFTILSTKLFDAAPPKINGIRGFTCRGLFICFPEGFYKCRR
jgi:hypothetical protein